MAGPTFFDNNVDRTLALQVPFILNCKSELIRPNLEACYSGNAAVGILQLDTIWSPKQSTRGSVPTLHSVGAEHEAQAEFTGLETQTPGNTTRCLAESKIIFSHHSKVIKRKKGNIRSSSVVKLIMPDVARI